MSLGEHNKKKLFKMLFINIIILINYNQILTLYLKETPFNAFANRADSELPDQGLSCLLMEI